MALFAVIAAFVELSSQKMLEIMHATLSSSMPLMTPFMLGWIEEGLLLLSQLAQH